MKFRIAEALALAAAFSPANSVRAQTVAAPVAPDLSTATPVEGSWTYSAIGGGSQATFGNSAALPQLVIACARTVRQVTISRPASAAAPFLSIWTSGQTRTLPASYNPVTGRISATVSAYDPLLDAIAFSRGRIAIGISGQAPLVVPEWPEPARVIEDCRA
jgi:hypothetical protein